MSGTLDERFFLIGKAALALHPQSTLIARANGPAHFAEWAAKIIYDAIIDAIDVDNFDHRTWLETFAKVTHQHGWCIPIRSKLVQDVAYNVHEELR